MPRTLKWFTTITQPVNLATGGQTNFNLLATLDSANTKGATITRIVLKIGANAPTTGAQGALTYGITTLAQEAVVAGAFPDTDVGADQVDWLVRGMLIVQGVSANGTESFDIDRHDLRAQRVLRDVQRQLHFILDASSISGGISFFFIARVLVRLP